MHYAVLQSEISLAIASVVSADDVDDVIIGEFAVSYGHDSSVNRVVMVSDSRSPFEISPDVIGLDCIDVIDLNEVVRVGDESPSYKLMDGDVFLQRSSPEVDVNVSPLVGQKFHFLAEVMLDPIRFSSTGPVEAPHSSEVAHFVKRGVFGEGDGSPLFDKFGVHQGNLSLEMPASFNMAYIAIQDGDVRCR